MTPMIRVACIAHDGTTFVVPANELGQHVDSLDDCRGDTEGEELSYTLTFKTISRTEFDSLGDFDGF